MKKFSKYLIALTLVTFVLLGAFISCDDSIEKAKSDFWAAFKVAVKDEVGEVADVTYSGDSITVIFKDDIGDTDDDVIDAVYGAATDLFGVLGGMVTSGVLTLDKKDFDIHDEEINVVVEVAKQLLGGGKEAAIDFLTTGEVTKSYSAKVKYDGVDFTLKGTLKFDIADAE